MNTVEIRNITKTFGKHVAVDDLSLDVPEGCIYGFIGPNGAGKTTTLRMIMNIFYPDSGSISVFGEELHGASTDRIGYLPEERGLYKKMSVRDLLIFYGDIKNGKNVPEQVDRWLTKFNLGEWADKKVEALSKGMSQKVQFISAVVTQPEMLILDEPFSGLDPVNQDVLKDAVLDMQSKGTTVIFSTHDMEVAEKICDFIFMIFKGKKVLDGTLESIQDKYGKDTMRVRTDNGFPSVEKLPGVESIRDFGHEKELRLAGDCDSQQLLTALMQHANVTSFEIKKPSLHDIFIRIADPNNREVKND